MKLDKPGDFVGRAALAGRAADSAPRPTLMGLEMRTRRVPRHGFGVLHDGRPAGTVTSGAPSPTLGKPIAMAYLDPEMAGAGGEVAVDIRGRAEPADLVKLPFYRRPA